MIPALDPQAGFAQEQAGLILASLDWALDVVESEHQYELVEHAEYRTLVADLLDLRPGDGAEEARQALEETSVIPGDLPLLRAETVR